MRLLKKLSNTLTRKRKQWACLHYWVKGLPVDTAYGKGYLYEYECKYCEKKVYYWTGTAPISGLIPDHLAHFKKDPRYNVSPNIIRKD